MGEAACDALESGQVVSGRGGQYNFVAMARAIADSQFQEELVKHAQSHGKLEADWTLPERCRNNLPQALDEKLHPWSQAAVLPAFPFGADLTADELHIVTALKRLEHATPNPLELVQMTLETLWEGKTAPPACLERLGLADPRSFEDMFVRNLFAGNL